MAHGFGTGNQARLSNEPQLFGCKCTDSGFLIERIQRRAQRKERGNARDNLPEPPALVIGERLAAAPIRLPIAKPLLQDRIATKLISPNRLRDIRKIGAVIQEKITGSVSYRTLQDHCCRPNAPDVET